MNTLICKHTKYLAAAHVLLLLCSFNATAADAPIWPCDAQSDDHDGNGFGGAGSSCLVTVESRPPPQITDLETGESILPLRAYWTESDLASKPIECQLYDWISFQNAYIPYDWTTTYTHLQWGFDGDAFIGRVVEDYNEPSRNIATTTADQYWQLDNGYYYGPGPFGDSRYVELIEGDNPNTNAIRIWRFGSSKQFWSCKPIDPNEFLWPWVFPPTTNTITDLYFVRCDDSAPIGDGWGWDGYGSCIYEEGTDNYRYVKPEYVGATPLPPGDTVSDGCDYTDADLYQGWGWNIYLKESCPPKGSQTEQPTDPATEQPGNELECIDSDGDGWGWDGFATCIPESSASGQCDYSDAGIYNGWGWNATTRESCPPG